MMFDAVPTMSEHAKSGRVKALGTTGQGALVGAAGRADDRRGGRPRLRSGDLARPPGAERHAAVDREPAQCGDREDPDRPEVRQEWASQGALPMVMSPEEFTRYLNDDIVKWERIVKISGAKADQ